MQYGDVADLPWGRERFERGAFGDVTNLDILMNVQHDRSRPVARTDGAGLVLNATSDALRVSAELAATPTGDEALANVEGRILRGLSVEFRAVDWKYEDEDMFVVERAELLGIGIVDKPAYKQSTIDRYRAMVRAERGSTSPEGSDATMTPEEVRAMVAEMLAARGDVDDEALARQIAERMAESNETTIREQVDEAVADARREAEEAEQARAEAEAERAAAEERAAEERAQIERDAEARAELIVDVRDLLPDDFDTDGASRHDILVAAVGDEIDNAAERSEDYLLAKVEDIVARRADAANTIDDNKRKGDRGKGSGRKVGDIPGVTGAVNIVKMRELAKSRARRSG